jgi:hypothetical protein
VPRVSRQGRLSIPARWSRVGEVLGVGVVVLLCLPLFAGWHLESGPVRDALTTGRVEAFIAGLGSIWWVLLCFALPATSSGRAYLRDSSGPLATRLDISTRTDNLVIAGLVLTGLTLGPATTAGKASGPLVAALSAFVAAWAAGFATGRMSSSFVRDALHWIGLSCLLAAAYGIAVDLGRGDLGPPGAVFGASLLAGAYSFLHARANWRSAHLPTKQKRGSSRKDGSSQPAPVGQG